MPRRTAREKLAGFFCKINFAIILLPVEPKLPDWFDPARDAVLTPAGLRGLVHPLRVQLLMLLERDGPATATMLAGRIGQSSGATSYHLRVLAEHGLIIEDKTRGNARDRWWAARHRMTALSFKSGDWDQEGVELAGQFVRLLIQDYVQRMTLFADELPADVEGLPSRPWGFDDWPLRLTEQEARMLRDDISGLLQKYRREPGDPDPRPGTDRAVLQLQLLPDPAPREEAGPS
jgi:DNA-binding transcriptional ArsR family regulator